MTELLDHGAAAVAVAAQEGKTSAREIVAAQRAEAALG
jgi:hypothetical protein